MKYELDMHAVSRDLELNDYNIVNYIKVSKLCLGTACFHWHARGQEVSGPLHRCATS